MVVRGLWRRWIRVAPARLRAALAGSVWMVLSGCHGPLSAAESALAEGRYVDAKRELAALDGESRGWEAPRRATYAVDRGIAYLALGDLARARVWLRAARALEQEHPGALSRPDVQRMGMMLDANDGMSLGP